MAKRVIVAMLDVDEQQFIGAGAASFATACTQASAAISHVLGTRSAVKLFVAPEYYFSNMAGAFAGGNNPTPRSRADKHTLYTDLKRISSQHSDMVIVAGSIFYQKTTGVFTKKTKGLNVCPILHNGKFLHKYYKVDDDGNIGSAINGAVHDHKDSNPVFTHDGIKFGIEICKDHTSRQLETWLNNKGAGLVDIHLYISATNTHQFSAIKAKVGGYLVHCDITSSARKHQVVKVNGTDAIFAEGRMNFPINTEAAAYTSGPMGDGSTVSVYILTV